MKASLLSALSAAISDNSVHVLQLRKIVVALAISGRLNAPDASIGREEILALLDDVKRGLISQRILAKQKPIAAITRDQLPEGFSDPSKFISLGQISRVEKGKTGIQKAKPGPYPLVVTAAERITADHYDFDGAAAIIPLVSSTGHGNASINRLHYQEGRFALGTILAAVLPHDPILFSARFLFEYLSAFKEELLVSRMSGTANVTLTLGRIEDVPVPLVPPVIQQQLAELMALCDAMEAARTERETKRDRLATASFTRFKTPDPETFRDDSLFALDILPTLTARPDQIKQLGQTILNLAVRGKLVPQDPTDEPAVELLKDIGKTRKKLNAEKRIPKSKELPSIDQVDLPFPVPSGWAWSMLGDLCYQVSDGPHFSPQYVSAEEGVPFLSARNIRLGSFDLSTVKYVSHADHEEFCKRIRPELGDIIYTKGGTTGIAKINDLDLEFSVWVHLAVLRIEKNRLCPRYVELALNSPHCYAQSQRYTQGTSNFDLGLTRMIKITIPLPPLAEQHRIVAKVDELMALCDQLKTSLTSADETRRKLLDALLAEALAPVDAEALQEAAE
jgi:type I restriction enzyme S subunit